MHKQNVVGSPLRWSRDFALVGLATGSAAPFFVIFDPWFAIGGGIAGACSGALLGGAVAVIVELLRKHMPLAVMISAMAGVGALWGATSGVIGGALHAAFGSVFGPEAVFLGFVMGGVAGMVQMSLFFPAYLFFSVKRIGTGPLVLASVLLTPFLGWAGMAALWASTFGLWLFALPFFIWAAVAIDRSQRNFVPEMTRSRAQHRAQRRPQRSLALSANGPERRARCLARGPRTSGVRRAS